MGPSAIKRVILSGGIGSGKSTVGRMLADRGALVIDADRVGHAVLEPGGAAYAGVAARWPEVVVDGVVDRGRLGRIVFSDPDQLAELEAMTHPAIQAGVEAMIAAAGEQLVVVELPLASDLLGGGWIRAVVVTPAAERRRRLVGRGLDPAEIERRMRVQPDAQWGEIADVVIENGGTLEELEEEVLRVVAEIQGA